MTVIQAPQRRFMLIASIDKSLEAASLVAKGPVKVDVSTLKQLPTDQMEFFANTVEVS